LSRKSAVSTILAAMFVIVIIIIAGSLLIYAYSTGLIGGELVSPGGGAHEALAIDSSSIINSTRISIAIRNIGPVAVTLVAYQVKDGAGNAYSNTAWAAAEGAPQQLMPNAVSNATFDINMGYCGCTLSGSPFTFSSTGTYTVTVTSARNNLY
jgi:hypothetical protein